MKISINDQIVDLKTDQPVEASVKNPLFTDVGDQTLPLTLPASKRNLEILRHPDRIDSLNATSSLDAEIHLGELNKVGTFDILSASGAEIEGTIYFGSGDFYARIKDTRLSELDFGGVRDPYTGTTTEKATQMLDHLMSVMSEAEEAEYHVFPIVVEYDAESKTAFILNETSGNTGTHEVFTAYNVITKNIDGVDITLPVGYGVTPFIRLYSLVNYVFKHFGYTLENNPWAEDFQLRKLVLLNNTADTVVAGKIDYSQIVPTSTVAEFIEMLATRGYVLFVRQNTRTAFFKRIDTMFASNADVDLTTMLSSELNIIYNKAKRLVLSSGLVDGAEPSFPSESALVRSYAQYGSFLPRKELDFTNEAPTANWYNVIRLSTGDFYNMLTGPVNSTFAFVKKVSTPYFNYEEPVTLADQEELTSPEELVSVDFPTIIGKPERLYPMYLKSVQHFNSEVRLQEGQILEEQENSDRTMTLCFAYGYARNLDRSQARHFYGSTQRYDNTGMEQDNCPLSLQFSGKDGLYENYYKEFEKFLKVGISVEFFIRIDDYAVEVLDISNPKRVHNQEYIIENVDYQLDGKFANVLAHLKRLQ